MSYDGDALVESVHAAAKLATLEDVLALLNLAVVETISVVEAREVPIASVALIDSNDLDTATMTPAPMPDVFLHIGVDDRAIAHWLESLGRRPAACLPKAVLSKVTTGSSVVRDAAEAVGLAFVGIHPQARWDRIYPLILDLVQRRRHVAVGECDMVPTDVDLFGLAQMLAESTGGMVSIEDAHSRVLAYSSSSDAADQLRISTIVRRDCPRDYLRLLGQWGVLDRLRRTEDVIEVPEHPDLGTRRRLVTGIRLTSPHDEAGLPAPFLGSIWVQEGHHALALESGAPLRGAAAVAARIIARTLHAPSAEGRIIEHLMGIRVEETATLDVASMAADLGITTTGPAALIGLAPLKNAGFDLRQDLLQLGGTLHLHVKSFRRDGAVAMSGQRAYLLLPSFSSDRGVMSWLRVLLDQLEMGPCGVALRAAVVLPVPGLGELPAARREADRVLDATTGGENLERVTTLQDSRTTVLLTEILDMVGRDGSLGDPRLWVLAEYDEAQRSQLRASATAYLHHFGDVRAAAASLNVHANTLRYRIRRVEEITGFNLSNPADRLLLHIHLAVADRAMP